MIEVKHLTKSFDDKTVLYDINAVFETGKTNLIIGYQFSEIVRPLMSFYFCGGSCVEDVTSQLMRHLSYHPTLRTCSSDTILRAIKELTQENISYTSDQGRHRKDDSVGRPGTGTCKDRQEGCSCIA